MNLNSKFYILNSRRGFTLVELLIYTAIFVAVIVSFITILIAITRVQIRQTAAAEVNQQSQFLLQQIQNYVAQSSLIELAQDTATTTLKLRMAASSTDPTLIYLSGSSVYIQQGGGAVQPMTSSRVNVTNLTFTKRANLAGHDSVSVAFTVAFNTTNLQQKFTEALSTSIARVNAATFDSDIRASSSNVWKIGAATQEWKSINNTIYFSGSNVGIGVSSPGQTLEVNGGVRLNTVTAKPTCDATQRGTFWVVQSGAGVADTVQVCAKNSSNAYSWYSMATIP